MSVIDVECWHKSDCCRIDVNVATLACWGDTTGLLTFIYIYIYLSYVVCRARLSLSFSPRWKVLL